MSPPPTSPSTSPPAPPPSKARASTHRPPDPRRTAAALVTGCVLLALPGCVVTPRTFESRSADRTLTVWSYLTETATDRSLSTVDALFAERHPDVEVEHVTVPLNEFGPKLLTAAGSGTGPDVVIGNPVADFDLLASAEVYVDLDPYWQRYADRRHFPEDAQWRDEEDRLRAVHWRFNDLGLWYNQDILQQYGLRPPRTVPELERALETVTADGRHGGITFSGDPSIQTSWAVMSLLAGEGAGYCDIDAPGTREVLRMLDRWSGEDYLPGDMATLGQEDAFTRFLNGKWAFAIGGSWEVGQVRATPPGFSYGTARIPAGPEGSRTSFAGESVGIGAFSDDKELAWDYLRTSYLSPRAQLATFEASGALPTREDTRRSRAVNQAAVNRPFIQALEPEALEPWPQNPNTLDAQTNFGTIVSAMIAGGYSAAEATERAVTRVREDLEEGGGGC